MQGVPKSMGPFTQCLNWVIGQPNLRIVATQILPTFSTMIRALKSYFLDFQIVMIRAFQIVRAPCTLWYIIELLKCKKIILTPQIGFYVGRLPNGGILMFSKFYLSTKIKNTSIFFTRKTLFNNFFTLL